MLHVVTIFGMKGILHILKDNGIFKHRSTLSINSLIPNNFD